MLEHLPFGFGEKVGFVNYCQNALNLAMQRVPRSILTHALNAIYKKEKKNRVKTFFNQFQGRVSICADNFGSHSYMGVTCYYMDNDWDMQKRILAFVFSMTHIQLKIFFNSLKSFFKSIIS